MSSTLSRRALLRIGAVGAVTVGSGLALKRWSDGALEQELAAVLGNLPAARVIGRRWLVDHPHGRELAATALAEKLGLAGRWTSGDELRRRLSTLIERDYAEGVVERVAGWVLSGTEIYLCALAVGR